MATLKHIGSSIVMFLATALGMLIGISVVQVVTKLF